MGRSKHLLIHRCPNGETYYIEDGLDLRRDCELVADSIAWAIRKSGSSEPLAVTVTEARQALEHALADVDLASPVVFMADNNLEQLVARSR